MADDFNSTTIANTTDTINNFNVTTITDIDANSTLTTTAVKHGPHKQPLMKNLKPLPKVNRNLFNRRNGFPRRFDMMGPEAYRRRFNRHY